MNDKEQKKAAKEFAARWQGKGYEKGQSQQFWIDLLVNVFGVKDIAGFIAFLFEGYYETACKLTTAAAGVGSGIQQPVVSVIITYLLGGIVALLCIAFILAGISSVGWLVYHVYQKYCWDEISPFVSLMSLAIVVSFASIMPLNIYLLLILSQIAYMIIRWLWEIKAIQGLFERIATRIEKWLDLKPNQQIGDLIIVFVIVVAVLTVRSWIKG